MLQMFLNYYKNRKKLTSSTVDTAICNKSIRIEYDKVV